jgi:hypothetical protein
MHNVSAATLVVFLALVPVRLASAQSRVPGVQQQRPEYRSEVLAMLQSGDPRQEAWGAWYSAQHVLGEMVPLLQDVVSRRITRGELAERAAADLALDALIHFGADVPSDLLLSVYDDRPAQALVLLSKHHQDAGGVLLELIRREKDIRWFAAANLALLGRQPGLAVVLLDRLKIKATLVVSEDGNAGVGSGLGVGAGTSRCGVGSGTVRGLPPWPTYQLTTFAYPGVVVLASGPTPIYYQRITVPSGVLPFEPQLDTRGPSTMDRLKYVAALGHLDPETLSLKPEEFHALAWQGEAALEAEMARIRQDIGHRYTALLRRLVNARALTPEEASAAPQPEIEILVYDRRRPAP